MDPSLHAMFKSVGVDPTKMTDQQLGMMSNMYKGLLKSDPGSMKDINETLAQGKIPVLPKNVGKKIQRNDKCECGSDKKYKKCCLGGVKNV
jgi:hypothetical protein